MRRWLSRPERRHGQAYFLKLKRGAFDEVGVALPRFLHEQGIPQVIAPRLTQAGRLWTELHDFRVILYPFIQGRSGFEVELSPRQWRDFGAALKRIPQRCRLSYQAASTRNLHAPVPGRRAELPGAGEGGGAGRALAVKVTELLKANERVILDLIQRAEKYARRLQAQSNEYVLCHADAHAGNILIDAQGALYVVDWDNPILAPKERDLMFIGGAQGFRGVTAAEEETLFYQGYGPAHIDPWRWRTIATSASSRTSPPTASSAARERGKGRKESRGSSCC